MLLGPGNADLTVAGHTHGGQVVLPGIGPIKTRSGVSDAIAAGGMHEINTNLIYVSTGVGMVRETAPQVRLFTRPSIGIIDVEPT